jgi:hypothetical protein
MSKRRKEVLRHTSLRLDPVLTDLVAAMATNSGWSVAKLVGFLAHTGRHALNRQTAAVDAQRQDYEGAVTIHRVERENAKRLADARKALRTPTAGKGSRPGTTAAAKAARKPGLPAVPPAKPDSAA